MNKERKKKVNIADLDFNSTCPSRSPKAFEIQLYKTYLLPKII